MNIITKLAQDIDILYKELDLDKRLEIANKLIQEYDIEQEVMKGYNYFRDFELWRVDVTFQLLTQKLITEILTNLTL